MPEMVSNLSHINKHLAHAYDSMAEMTQIAVLLLLSPPPGDPWAGFNGNKIREIGF